MPADDVHPQGRHLQALGDADDLASDIPHADDEQAPPLALGAGEPIAGEGGELAHLQRQAAEQGRPEEHGLLGDGPGTVERQVPQSDRAGGVGKGAAKREHVVIAGGACQDGVDLPRPGRRNARLRANADDARGRGGVAGFLRGLPG